MRCCSLSGRHSMRPASLVAWVLLVVLVITFNAPLPVLATEMVYRPTNPSFGGDPSNGPVLLNSANAQNNKTDPNLGKSITGSPTTSALSQFSDMLQRTILSRVATSVSGGLFDTSGRLIPGTVDTANFSISIADQGGGKLVITTADKTTGQMTSFEVTQ